MARRPLHGAPKPEGTYSHRHDGSASKRNQEGAGAPERRGEGGRNMREELPEGRPGRRLRDEAPQPHRCSALRSHLWLYSLLGRRGGGGLAQRPLSWVPEARTLRAPRTRWWGLPDALCCPQCLAAGSIIMNRELESMAMRPLAKELTRSLEDVRGALRDQALRDLNTYTEKMREALRHFDVLFAEFELR